MLEFLQSGKALAVLVAIGMIGIVSKLITRSLYRRLLKETDNMAMTKNKNLRILKQKLENIYRLNQNIVNTQAYLDKQMYSFKFLRVTLDGWNNISTQMMILLLMAGGVGSFLSYWYRLDSYYIVLYASMGALGSLFLAFVDSSFAIGRRQQRLETALVEYMDNSAFVRAARENSGRDAAGAAAPVRPVVEKLADRERAVVRDQVRDQAAERERIARENEIKDGLVREEEPRRFPGRASRSRNSRAEELLRTVRSMKAEEERSGAGGANRAERADRPELKKETDALSSREDGGSKRESEAQRDIDYLKHSLEQIAASRERSTGKETGRTGNLKEEELKIIGEFMKQYFSY